VVFYACHTFIIVVVSGSMKQLCLREHISKRRHRIVVFYA